MQLIHDIFDDRKREILSHISLLKEHEQSFISQSTQITPPQFHVLISCSYLLIYNMIESVIVNIVKEFEKIISASEYVPERLTDTFQKEWIKYNLKNIDTSKDETIGNNVLYMLKCLKKERTFEMKIKIGTGGNWSESKIFELSKRLGVNYLQIPAEIMTKIKNKRYDGKGCVDFVVSLRNKLAHGEISFSDCGQDKTIDSIEEIYQNICIYLEEIIKCFCSFIDGNSYITPLENQSQQDVF